MTTRPSTQEEFLRWQFADNGIVELRHEHNSRWTSGVFNDQYSLEAAIGRLAGSGNLFTSLNAPKPRHVGNKMGWKPFGNDDIGWVTRLPFDFDPVRPTGIPSTDGELAEARSRRDGLVAVLRKQGWTAPLLADSGNGAHAQYRCRLPNNAETAEQFRAIYMGIAAEFSDDVVHFDQAVRNPGRIFRLYGTTNRKGVPTEDRPHRLAACWIPDRWLQVDRRQIEALANYYTRQNVPEVRSAPISRSTAPKGLGDYRTLDVVAWVQSHELYRSHRGGNVHGVWCPWRDDHTTGSSDGDAVVFESDGGWPGFSCKHSHCQGRDIRDLIDLLGDADSYCSEAFSPGVRS